MFKLTRTSFYYLHKHTLFNGDLNFWSAATYCVDFFCFGLCRLTGEKKKFIDKNLNKTIPSFSSFCSAVYSMITTITLPVTSSPQFHKWMGNDRNVKTTAHNFNIGNLSLCPPSSFIPWPSIWRYYLAVPRPSLFLSRPSFAVFFPLSRANDRMSPSSVTNFLGSAHLWRRHVNINAKVREEWRNGDGGTWKNDVWKRQRKLFLEPMARLINNAQQMHRMTTVRTAFDGNVTLMLR